MKRIYVLLGLVVAVVLPRAWGQDDQYVQIFNQIQEADSMNNLRPVEALPKYLEAQRALVQLQKAYPDWNAAIVNFRLRYIASKIEEIRGKVPGLPKEAVVSPGTEQSGKAQGQAELERQISVLQNQLRQLQADRSNLEAKLKEALAVRPANLDPAALARADERINLLQKENDLLKVKLAEETTKPSPEAEESQTSSAELGRKLAEQVEKTKALELERKTLQNRLDTLIPSGWNAARIEETRKALAETNRQLTEEKELNSHLTKERDALQAQVKSLTAQAKAAEGLRKENLALQAQVEDLKRSTSTAAVPAEQPRQLAEAEAHIAALQSDKELLRLENIALENRLKALQSSNATEVAAVPSAAASKAETRRLEKLERERDDLQRKLEAANEQLAARKSKGHVKELENEVASLRLRLDALEAKPEPYTAEELALLERPGARLADSTGEKKSVHSLPPGSASLVAEANRYFARREFDKAETTYLDILKRDKRNPVTLANLAAVQLEMDHLDQAEAHLTQALVQAPEDAYSYSLLGQLKFRQKQYDQALEALSRAAQLDPQNAEIQNYLGLVLSEKGMRKPAEAALRKAIQLKPNYAAAHNNLAVIYLSQQPPLIELARWHYQKALAAGGEKNPKLEQMLESRAVAAH